MDAQFVMVRATPAAARMQICSCQTLDPAAAGARTAAVMSALHAAHKYHNFTVLYDMLLLLVSGAGSALYSYSSLNNPRMAAMKAALGVAYLWAG